MNMNTELVQKISGTLLPAVLAILGLAALAKGSQMLVQHLKTRKKSRGRLSIMPYDGIMDELV
jgi:hypothetical protein